LADRGFVVGAVDVVGAEDVGDEQPVEPAAFEQPGQIGPVREVLVLGGPVVRMPPQTGGLVGDAVHVEGVEANGASHRRDLRRRVDAAHCFHS
jgi:hypothetical protein